jgi:hypothetical protein
MPRAMRVEYPGAIYHVMDRGDRQEDIFHPHSVEYLRAHEKQIPFSFSNSEHGMPVRRPEHPSITRHQRTCGTWEKRSERHRYIMSRLKQSRFGLGGSLLLVSMLIAPGVAKAIQMSWSVDASVSYIRITIPDQQMYVTNLGNVTVGLRDAGNNNSWTDAGGRRAAIGGTIVTDYADATSISFLTNAQNLYALEQTSLRPNPADWSTLTTNYIGTSTAPAAFGARVRATYVLLVFPITADAAFMALRNVQFDISSGVVPIVGGTLAGNQTQCGISSAIGDVDGLDISGLGQPVPDVLGGELSSILSTNTVGGTIQNMGGQIRKLTYNINMSVVVDAEGMTLVGSAVGQLVATGTIPELPTLRIAGTGAGTVVLAWPSSTLGFVLQQNPILGSTNWSTVTNAPVVVGSEKQVTLPASEFGAFYRLRGE